MLRLFRLVLPAEIFKAECKSASGARRIKWTQKLHQGREDGSLQHLSTGTFYMWGTGQAPVDTRALLTSALGWELWASAHLTDKQLEAPRAEARAARLDGECGQAAGESPHASQAGDAGQLQADSTQTTLWRRVLPPPQTAGGGGCTHLPTHCYQSFISLQCKCLEMGLQNPIRINSSPRDAITGILTLSLSFITFSEFLLKKEHISLFTIRRTVPFPL